MKSIYLIILLVAIAVSGCLYRNGIPPTVTTSEQSVWFELNESEYYDALSELEQKFDITFKVEISDPQYIAPVTFAVLQKTSTENLLSIFSVVSGLNVVPLGDGVYHVDDVADIYGDNDERLPFYKGAL